MKQKEKTGFWIVCYFDRKKINRRLFFISFFFFTFQRERKKTTNSAKVQFRFVDRKMTIFSPLFPFNSLTKWFNAWKVIKIASKFSSSGSSIWKLICKQIRGSCFQYIKSHHPGNPFFSLSLTLDLFYLIGKEPIRDSKGWKLAGQSYLLLSMWGLLYICMHDPLSACLILRVVNVINNNKFLLFSWNKNCYCFIRRLVYMI